jgi:hypothetical protein
VAAGSTKPAAIPSASTAIIRAASVSCRRNVLVQVCPATTKSRRCLSNGGSSRSSDAAAFWDHVPQHVGVRMDLRRVRRVGCRSGARWPTSEDVMHPQLESSQAVSSETRIAYGTASGWDVVPDLCIERV